jgi:hypothetical protein
MCSGSISDFVIAAVFITMEYGAPLLTFFWEHSREPKEGEPEERTGESIIMMNLIVN